MLYFIAMQSNNGCVINRSVSMPLDMARQICAGRNRDQAGKPESERFYFFLVAEV